MNIEAYDNSIEQKLKSIFPNVVYADTERALKESAEDNNGAVKLPLISVYRTESKLSIDSGHLSMPAHKFGRKAHDYPGPSDLTTQSIPLDITYQVDIWSVDRSHCDNIYRELLFYLIDCPNLTVEIPHVGTEDFAMTITDSSTEVDTSSFSDTGRLYRNTITLEFVGRLYRQVEYSQINKVKFTLLDLTKFELKEYS